MNVALKLSRSSDHEIVFESRARQNLILVGFGVLMVTVAIGAQGHGQVAVRIGVLAMGSLLAWAGITGTLWRERLVLDLLGRRFRRDRGYFWQIGTRTGSLDEIEATTLSTELRGGGRGGTYTVFGLEVRFRQPIETVKIEGFRTEGEARELIALLSRTLHVSFIDRTVQPTRQVDWKDVAKPLVERDAEKRRGISSVDAIPPPPADSGIELSRTGVQLIITLPRSGLSIVPLIFIVFASIFAWIGYTTLRAMLVATLRGTEHYWTGWVIGSLFSLTAITGILQAISSMLAREYVRDEGNTLVIGKRMWGMAYGKSIVAKDAVMDIAMSPAQSAEGNYARVQRTLRERLPLVGNWQVSIAILQKEGRRTLAATLRSGEQQWLVDALRAMCESRVW